ncbi:ATP-binding protein [Streptomyces sp. NPDC058486]|uniref:ATP-binding protein n=1 Tax=unclassified Streptomyces TaxID=2593676 RepID=UPI00365649D6
MTRYQLDDPQPPVPERLRARLEAKLAERGINPAAALPDTPEPIPALEAAQLRIPIDYREALVEHAEVAAWVRKVSEGAVAPSAGGLNPQYGASGRRRIMHGPSLMLWGNLGTGKTHQAYAAIRALTATGCGVSWHATTAADLFGDTRPQAGVDLEHQLRRIVRVPLLLLDDVGAAKVSAWNEEVLFRLVNWRSENKLPTIFTTNLAPVRELAESARQPVLRDVVGDRVLSRLSGMCTPVRFTGPDRRFQR